jgi:cysteine desulfurase
MATYLDCNATTPMDPRVQEEILHYMSMEFGNAGSRTHEYGARANQAVKKAREQIAEVVQSKSDEIIFTSGATESNNIAILGLAQHGEDTGKNHIISTQIEHKAILEPLEHLEKLGFEITLLPPNKGGWVEPEKLQNALRPNTLLVSVMHVNNETGVIQPIEEMADVLSEHDTFFHTDSAQGFGKDIKPLQHPLIDLISISGHKIYGPKGVGALVTRRRRFERPPLNPLMFGGGQEKGLRPGTLPVHLIAGLGKAAYLAQNENEENLKKCLEFKTKILKAFEHLNPVIHGDPNRTVSHTLNISFSELNSEAVIISLKHLAAISNGSACTSTSYEPSHVLKAMGLSNEEAETALRWSWCQYTPDINFKMLADIIYKLK